MFYAFTLLSLFVTKPSVFGQKVIDFCTKSR